MPVSPAEIVRSHAIEEIGDLSAHLPPGAGGTCWLRRGEGLVSGGRAVGRTFSSAAEADSWWQELVGACAVQVDPALADEPMAGPVAFVSFPFDLEGGYEIVVPEVLVGRRRDRSWLTTWNDAIFAGLPFGNSEVVAELAFEAPVDARARWLATVDQARARIRAGELEKVVLARTETARSTEPIDLRPIVAQLARGYPQTWTFCVKGLVGASPELMIRQDRGLITSRVLAGTIHGQRDSAGLAKTLSSSSKDLAEHEYAVASVAEALRPHASSLHVPEIPSVLQLPNVMHLATDISGAVRPGRTVISLAAAIHPSAAVCGTPTAAARALIGELETIDRGRYAGPVGWINAGGDGEIALALRCGQVSDKTIEIFAGCGIVADSDPEAEWDETAAKLLPMKQALGVAPRSL